MLLQYSTHLAVSFCHGETFDPLLGVGAVFGLEHEGSVVGEDFEGFGDVSPAFFGHLHGADGAHVQ